MHTLRAFAAAEKYAFPLLSDFWPHGAVAADYDVFNERNGAATRGSFLIDIAGVLRWRVINHPGEARPVAAYQEAIAALG
jgi:mycoredoxin-dependent peroxiredoxin